MTKYTAGQLECDGNKPTKHCFVVAVFFLVDIRMDKDSSMTVDWGEFLHHVILNPVDNIGELVSSWKHNLVRSSFDAQQSRGVHKL